MPMRFVFVWGAAGGAGDPQQHNPPNPPRPYLINIVSFFKLF